MNEEMKDEEAANEPVETQIFHLARCVPTGRVLSYGSLGALCEPPVSGYICGRILGRALGDVPWWRIVGKKGNLPIRKRAPQLEEEQRERLNEEGIAFDETIDMARYEWRP
ncbi:MAG TPA: MGMT family protein [Abditibacteriaceae bacterium]|jgi:methylated-DNA-protein-cysteine methyltransferase-like protein